MAWHWISDKTLSEPMLSWFTDTYLRHEGEMSQYHIYWYSAWRWHDLNQLSALLVFCERNTAVTGGFPHKGPVMWVFDVFSFMLAWTSSWTNSQVGGDLRCCDIHVSSLIRCPWLTGMKTSSNETLSALLAICAGPGEFPVQRPVTRSFGVFFYLRLNKSLRKQSWGWWFEMLSCPLWRHCNRGISFNGVDYVA